MQGRRKGARLFHGGNTSVASSRRAPWPGARRIYSFFVTEPFPANRLTNNRDLLEKGDRRERSTACRVIYTAPIPFGQRADKEPSVFHKERGLKLGRRQGEPIR